LEIYKLSVSELTEKLKNKELSSFEVTKSFLDRIEKVEPQIQAFNYINKDALSMAKKVDEKRLNGDELNDFAGIPIAIKDNICTKGIHTTCSSKILENFIPPYNATVYERLLSANLIPIGKTNMDEFAMGSSTENSAFRTTSNPYDLERVPGGSSGGSSASVASYEVPISLGSDTGGSIRQPAALCGTVGMKPTYGLVSRFGLIAYASSLDQIGPFSNNVRDNALLLNLIAGYDSKDSTSINKARPDYTLSLKNDVKGLKIALVKEMFGEGIDKEINDSVLNSVKLLESLGASVDEISMPISDYSLSAYYIIAPAEASSNLARYDGVKYGLSVRDGVKDLESLYVKTRSAGFGDEVKRRIMIGTYTLSSGYYDAHYKKALQYRTLLVKELNNIFEDYDIIISPTTPTTAFKKGEKKFDPMSMYMSDILTVMVNLAGIPAISMPCGFDSKGLPIGIQIMGKTLSEETIYQVSYTLEQNLNLVKDLKL